MGIVGVLVKCSSPGPIVFRQRRAGRFGLPFELLKFRTMTIASGPLLTRQGDRRVTRIGRILRRTKLDELPQLVNVVRGDMSLVGPRPDVAHFWDTLKGTCPQIFELRPGLTGEASLHFRNEESLLGSIPDERLTDYYLSTLLPQKARMDLQYAKTATLLSDVKLLFATFFELFGGTR
jgi:lipopolysaccharide/colanic/teichoic acid biosynthesis glycosyltransferase